MIDLLNIFNEMISDASDSGSDFITKESNERFIEGLDPSFLKLLEETEQFYSILTHYDEEYIMQSEKSI